MAKEVGGLGRGRLLLVGVTWACAVFVITLVSDAVRGAGTEPGRWLLSVPFSLAAGYVLARVTAR